MKKVIVTLELSAMVDYDKAIGDTDKEKIDNWVEDVTISATEELSHLYGVDVKTKVIKADIL